MAVETTGELATRMPVKILSAGLFEETFQSPTVNTLW